MSGAVTVYEKETGDRSSDSVESDGLYEKREKGNGPPASGVRLPSFLA